MGPPMSGPNGAPTAPEAVQIAVAMARFSEPKSAGMRASDMGIKTDEARPISTRAAISSPGVIDTAARKAPAMNRPTPPSNRRRCPNRSPKAPPSSSTDSEARLYEETIHSSWPALAPSPDAKAGSATLTIVVFMNSRTMPRQRAIRPSHPCLMLVASTC